MTTESNEKESRLQAAWREFVGGVGLAGDLLVDAGTALQNWSARRWAKSVNPPGKASDE